MGRIVTTVDIQNVMEPSFAKKLDILVDTGASHLTLPRAWKEQFGAFQGEQEVEMETATQAITPGLVCGPVKIQVEGFRPVYGEVLFIDMTPANGEYEPLLGYIPLEQSGVAVDLLGHRLLPVQYLDLKSVHQAPKAAGLEYGRQQIQF